MVDPGQNPSHKQDMYDVHDIKEAAAVMKTAEKEPSQFEKLVGQSIIGAFLLFTVFALLYLSVVLFQGQSGGCNYSGEIPIHTDFIETYENHCLVIGPPISAITTANLDGIDGVRTVQYFEGALLTGPAAGNSMEADVYPLGIQRVESLQSTGSFVSVAQLNNLPDSALQHELLGEALGGIFENSGQLLIIYENGSLLWDSDFGRFTRQSLGRDHALEYASDTLIEVELTRVTIPNDSIRFFLDTFNVITSPPPQPPEFVMDVTVKHPILFPEDQQTVTVEVFDRLSNTPAEGLLIGGSVYFSDFADTATSVTFSPTAVPGVYTAIINLPDHPEGTEGRDVLIDVSFRNASSDEISATKTFKTWW
ncbi:MAG: hypothetical protein AAF902_05840 [Chloroflexota bacterium]